VAGGRNRPQHDRGGGLRSRARNQTRGGGRRAKARRLPPRTALRIRTAALAAATGHGGCRRRSRRRPTCSSVTVFGRWGLGARRLPERSDGGRRAGLTAASRPLRGTTADGAASATAAGVLFGRARRQTLAPRQRRAACCVSRGTRSRVAFELARGSVSVAAGAELAPIGDTARCWRASLGSCVWCQGLTCGRALPLHLSPEPRRRLSSARRRGLVRSLTCLWWALLGSGPGGQVVAELA
jgi:hypothetical protein